MRTLCDHIFDIASNSIAAGARNIDIRILEDPRENIFMLMIEDDGRGIPPEDVPKVTDPFYTTRDKNVRRVGLGLGMMEAACQRANGEMRLVCEPGKGTKVIASMEHDNIDRTPLGDVVELFVLLIMVEKDVIWTLEHGIGSESYRIRSDEVADDLGIPGLGNYRSSDKVKEYLAELEKEVRDGLDG